MKKRFTIVIIIIFLFGLNEYSKISTFEFDMESRVSRIIDGDTFDLVNDERIRLADIDTPESYETGYYQAKNALSYLISGKSVFLDIDDKYRTDNYGRLVCVVYVESDSGRYLNVNKALLDEGYADLWDHDNEFNPSKWSLYTSDNSTNYGNYAFLGFIFIFIIIYMKRRK